MIYASTGISVVLCCYNSAKRLQKVLYHLSMQDIYNEILWEIILVNNNSTDDTVLVAQSEWRRLQSKVPFKIVDENQPGLSFARLKGVREAAFDTIIFCDDDNWLHKDYIATVYLLMRNSENIGIAGGMSVAHIDTAKPSWFHNYENVFAVGKQLPTTGYANKRGYLTGAGMVMRKQVFDQLGTIGFYSILSDRKGNELSSGGDSEICLLAMQLGYDLYYDERLQFTHYITANRLQWKYCVEMITKGFAHPQIYYAMYDYCFNTVNNNETASFKHLIRWNLRKQKRILINEFKGIRNFFAAISALMYSKEGNEKEIKVKTAVNKILYMRKNKKQLAEDFDKIIELAKRIKQYRLITTPSQE